MNPNRPHAILKKVEELKALLVFSRRIIPFMEDVLGFVRDIMPVMDELQTSVEISSTKLPRASRQLDKVTMATEMASTEILNLVEGIVLKIQRLREHVARREDNAAALGGIAGKIDALLAAEQIGHPDQRLLATLWEEYKRTAGPDAKITEARGSLDAIENDCTNIMIALQVQDITAQQIAAVNKLMESVDAGLNTMLSNFREVSDRPSGSKFSHPRLDIPFDTSAEYSGVEERQRMADRIVAGKIPVRRVRVPGRKKKESSSKQNRGKLRRA